MNGEPIYSTGDPQRPEWHARAACRGVDQDVFFPSRGEDVGFAKAYCQRCPVRRPCAEQGLYEKFGVWGGMGERARRRRRQQLGIRLPDTDHDNQPNDEPGDAA